MSATTALRDHCRQMADAEHKPDCPSLTAREPYWPPGGWVEEDDGGLRWLGRKPKWEPPKCDGCNPASDRALFARIAAEIDTYLGDQLALLEIKP